MMGKNHRLIFGLMAAAAFILIAASGDQRISPSMSEAESLEKIAGEARAPCTMYKYNPAHATVYHYASFANGDIIVTYFDPAQSPTGGCGVAATYPFTLYFRHGRMADIG